MNLLKYRKKGDYQLQSFNEEYLPPYAVLSHTWGEDGEEVTFRDMTDVMETGRDKTGFQKLKFCGEQANQDGLKYFWVDTCNIDKSNSAELQRAINSMFKWYRNAAVCYVYLADVSVANQSTSEVQTQAWEPAFRKCKWFTRGWTLQELLAPTSVKFYSKEGIFLGDKTSLETQIHEITGIPISALQGDSLTSFSIDERRAWAEKRITKYREDKIYSLLGIFGVFMPLIYGEGERNASARLNEEIEKRYSTALVGGNNYIYSIQVGGIGGDHFEFIAGQGSANGYISKLEVWSTRDFIAAIQVTFSNGYQRRSGTIAYDHGYAWHHFQDDERITSYTLWNNYYTDRLGGIRIDTNKNSFEFGYSRKDAHRSSDVGAGVLVGVVGSFGLDIDRLGLVFLK